MATDNPFGQIFIDANTASDLVRQGINPQDVTFQGPSRAYNAFQADEERRKQQIEQQRQQEIQKQLAAQSQAQQIAMGQNAVLEALQGITGHTPSVDLGGGPTGQMPQQQGGSFTNNSLPNQGQAPQMSVLDRLMTMGHLMPPELFNILASQVMKQYGEPAASEAGLATALPGMSPEQRKSLGRVPESAVQKHVFSQSASEPKIALQEDRLKLQENIAKMRDLVQLGQLEQARKAYEENIRQFDSREQRLREVAATPRIPAELANKIMQDASKRGMSRESMEQMLGAMGFQSQVIPGGMFSNDRVVPALPEKKGQSKGDAPRASAPASEGRVRIQMPNGQTGTVPSDQVKDFEARGAKVLK